MGSTADPERIARRATYVREQVERLRALVATTDTTAFTASENWMAVGAVRYALQTSIEAMIDIAFHISAKRLSRAPDDAYAAFAGLETAGLLPHALTTRAHALVGFRNRVVHRYHDVSDARVLQMIREELGDFEAVLAGLEAAARQ